METLFKCFRVHTIIVNLPYSKVIYKLLLIIIIIIIIILVWKTFFFHTVSDFQKGPRRLIENIKFIYNGITL